jgi:hypothetical protein
LAPDPTADLRHVVTVFVYTPNFRIVDGSLGTTPS